MKIRYTIIIAILITCGLILAYLNFLYYFYKLERIEFEINDEDIDDFAYWLDSIDKDDIEHSKYDLIIIDYSSDGTEENEFSSKDVKYMKSSGSSEKFLLSYISIGEAEDYRFYWQESWDANQDGTPDGGAPDWLDNENSDWEGNYKVKYWEPGWQQIVYNYLDKIITANFDGIYMDIIDAYEYYEDTIIHSDWLMIDFVVNISNYVNTIKGGDFLVFAQNGEELFKNTTYLDKIDGIGCEDLFYDSEEVTEEDWREERIENLNKALDEEKVVLIIDYPDQENKYDFYKNCIENGFLPYGAERDLDSLSEFLFYPPT